jgi:hypothetical protein
MLQHLPRDAAADREDWFRIMCAVHHALGGAPMPAWFDAWCRVRAGGHYDPIENANQWASLSSDTMEGCWSPITVGTLAALARERGYRPPITWGDLGSRFRHAERSRHGQR